MAFVAIRLGCLVVILLGLIVVAVISQPFANEDSGWTGASRPAYQVSVTGNDSWSGLLSNPSAAGTDGPFATLSRARDAMRLDPEIDTTYVRDGTYQLEGTLRLTSEDSGVSFVAFEGETPILSGAQANVGTLVKLDNADGVNLLGLTFSDARADAVNKITGIAIDMSDADNSMIAYNTFSDVNVAVNVTRGSDNNAILGNELAHIGYQGVRLDGSDGNMILGNHIYDIGTIFPKSPAAGIKGRNIEGNTIAYNLIEDSTQYGISIKDGGSDVNRDNVIEYNRILNTNTVMNDSGAIEMLGRSGADTNTIIRYNYIETTGVGKNMTSGVYLDDLTSGVEIYGNFIKDNGIAAFHLHGGRNIAIENNIVILADEPVYGINGNKLEGHELFVWEQPVGSSGRVMDNIEWSGNIISAPDGLTPDADYWRRSGGDLAGEPSVNNNLLHNVEGYDGPASGTPEARSILANPLFVDPANGNYALQANSPAYDLDFKPLPFDNMGPAGHPRGLLQMKCCN